MPGRLRTNFRFGNLAEHLGILLLKGVAAVVDVPRQEDVGLDAIATLLRRDDDGNCYAEDSFLVQLKSESVSNIEYRDHELQWLLGQGQPLFIGRVSLANSKISLYPTLIVIQAVLALHAKAVTVRCEPSTHPDPFPGKNRSWVGGDNSQATVWLGNPLLTWNLGDLVEREWVERTYRMLKKFLAIARRELELLSFSQCSMIDWSTNDPDSITSKFAMMKGSQDDLDSLVKRDEPFLHAIMLRALWMPQDSANSLMHSLLMLAVALRDSGVEIDPDNMFGKMFFAIQQKPGGTIQKPGGNVSS